MNGLTPPSTTFRARLIGLALLAGITAIGLGGCNKNQKADALTISQLQEENKSLRDENERLNTDARAAAERASALEAENATLKAAPAAGGSAGGGGRGSDRILTVAGDVAFGPGQITLTAAGKREIDKIISIIRSQYSGHRIEIAGHTDSDPLRKTKDKYTDNENLSAQRALAVERYMNSQGISPDLTHSSAYGPSHPKGSKKDSRRVEIKILAN